MQVFFGSVFVLAVGLVAGCGSQAGQWAEIPGPSGNDRAPIALNAGPDELARRSAGEREQGHLARAERFARWALALDPEHPGALVAAARVAVDLAAQEASDGVGGSAEVARRHFAAAASLDARVAGLIEVERGTQLLAYARSEKVAGRVEQAAALLEEIEAETPKLVSAERRQVANLYGELADIWLERGLGPAARATAERAAKLGADGERTRLRLLLSEVVSAPADGAVVEGSGLGSVEPRLVAELGRDAARWQAVTVWANRAGRFATGVWAGLRTTSLDAELSDGWVVLADAYAGLQRGSDAANAWQRAAGLMKPADGAMLLARAADRIDIISDRVNVMLLAKAAAELAPGSEGGVRGATLAAFTSFGLNQRDEAMRLLEVAARSAPKAWQEIIAPALVKGDHLALAKALAAARGAGLVDWVAHAIEAAHWRTIGAGVGTPELKAEAALGSEAAFDAALAATPGLVGGLELARLALGLPERVAKVRALRVAGASLYLDAGEARADLGNARALLETGLGVTDRFESAFVRAHFELEAGEPARAMALAEAAVRGAEGRDLAAAEAFAMRLAFNGPGPQVEARARSWLAVASESGVLEAPYRGQYLARLLGVTRANPELALRVQEALLSEPSARWSTSLDDVRAARRATLAKLGRVAEADDWAASVDPRDDSAPPWRETRTGIEALMVTLNQEGPDRMLRYAARIHPDEFERLEIMGDMVRLLLWRQEPYRARRLVERILSLPDGNGIGSARLLTLAQDLLDAGRLDLAARAFERVAALGERSPKVFFGWLRALLRAGDLAQADAIATRAMETRPRRDARALEELAKVLSEEGRLGRAIELFGARLGDGERLEPSTFNMIVEALARAGRSSELTQLAHRFIDSDSRGTQRLQAQAATRLMEVGALEEAQLVIDEALNLKKRDPQLLTLATTLALARGSPDAEAVADRLLKEAGGAFDVWDRVVGDVRASTRSEAATRLVTAGLERFAGAHRLLLLRGRVQVLAGQGEAAFLDFAEALARAPAPRDVLDVAEPLLLRTFQFERLAALESRALALGPGRADTTLMLGRALTGAGRVDEAGQVFQRVVAETDRAHGLVADAWFAAGYFGTAIDAWAKVEPSLTEDAVSMLDNVSTALAERGEASRLDTFVRLYLQALRGTSTPPLMPVALAFRKVGRIDEAIRWFERADRETPSPETVLALMRLRLDLGDRAGALVAAERVVTRRIAQSPPARLAGTIVGPALDPLALELTTLGYPDLARDLALRVAGMQGESTATRLVAARAMLANDDLAGALEQLEAPFEPWRQQRELIGLLRGVLNELVARGHVDAALALSVRAVDAGAEREILLGAVRIAARAGDGPTAVRFGRRLTGMQPNSNGWLVGDLLASERMPRASVAPLTLALQQVRDTPLKFAATALTLGQVATEQSAAQLGQALDAVLAQMPSLAEDRVDRALLEGFVASTLPDTRLARRSAQAFLPAFGRGATDPAVANLAVLMASFVDEATLGAVWRALRATNVDETKLRLQLGGSLSNAFRLDAALTVYDGLGDSEGGDGELALRVFATALTAGDGVRAQRWADSALGRIPGNAPATLRLMFADKAAQLGATALALALISDDQAETWRKSRVKARIALAGGDLEAFRLAIEQRLLRSPDEAVARVESALLVLTRRPGAARDSTRDPAAGAKAQAAEGDTEAKAWRDEAFRIVEPLVRDEEAPALALELAFAASRDSASARPFLERSRRHFPGAFRQPALMLRAAFRLEDASVVAVVLATMAPEARRELLLQLVQARVAVGEGPFGAAMLHTLEAEVARATPTDVTAQTLEVALARLAGNGAGALQAAESASARAPWSSGLSLLLAQTLIQVGNNAARAERAERIVRAVMARPGELALFDAEQRFLVPATQWRAWEVLAAVQSLRGEREAGQQSLARAVALAPEAERARLWATLGEPSGAGEFADQRGLRACVALERVPWSALCADRL